MKKFFFFVVAMVCAVGVYAQSDVTKFLGIPVDGFKDEMISKLKAKGFRSSSLGQEGLEGEFNGRDVYVFVVTNNNKVYRIVVCDANEVSEGDIRIRFNTLCRQFEDNPRYFALQEDQTIPEKDNISYEMIVNKKRYEAVFYQKPIVDSVALMNEFKATVSSKYTKEQLDNFMGEQPDKKQEEIAKEIAKEALMYIMTSMTKKYVWFKISETRGKYYIAMFYDNEYNKANGEDL